MKPYSAGRSLDAAGATPQLMAMPPADKPPKPPGPEREANLAQALRANLRRRKAGAREPAATAGQMKSDEEA